MHVAFLSVDDLMLLFGLFFSCILVSDDDLQSRIDSIALFDKDGDGIASVDDCDDDDPTVPILWFRDQDGDGFGLEADSLLECVQPDGYVDNSLDCDDTLVEKNALDEDGDGDTTCDGDCDDNNAQLNERDEDGDRNTSCSGDCDDRDSILNQNDEDGDGQSTCAGDCDDFDPFKNNFDEDGDGFSTCQGDCDDFDVQLELFDIDGDGYTTCDGDCNDENPYIHPDKLEISYDSIDQNCDGLDESVTEPVWAFSWVQNTTEAISLMNDSNKRFFSWGKGEQGYFIVYRTDNPTEESWTIAPVGNLADGVRQLAPHVKQVRVSHSLSGNFVAYTEDDLQGSSWVLISHSEPQTYIYEVNEKNGVDDFLSFVGSNGQQWHTYVYDEFSYENRYWQYGEFNQIEEVMNYLNEYRYCDVRLSVVDNFIMAFFR